MERMWDRVPDLNGLERVRGRDGAAGGYTARYEGTGGDPIVVSRREAFGSSPQGICARIPYPDVVDIVPLPALVPKVSLLRYAPKGELR